MPYANAAAVSRPELKVFLEQARLADKNLIADQILPVKDSPGMTGRYPKFTLALGGLLDVELNTKRGADGSYNRVSRKWEWDTYDCQDRGLEGEIDDSQAHEMAQFTDLEQTESKLVRRNVALSYEIRVANLVMSSANSGFTATNSVTPYTEANIATMDFPQDITNAQARLEGNGTMANAMVISLDVWNRVRRSTKLLQYIFGNTIGNGGQALDPKRVADAFQLDNIFISGKKYNAGKKGQNTVSLSSIWGTSTVLLANIQGGDFNTGGIGRTLTWTEDASGLYVVETYREEKLRKDIVRVRQNTSEKIIDTNEAQLITTQWS